MKELTTSDHWHELQIKLKEKYPELSAADLAFQEPMQQDMLRIVAYKLSKTKEELQVIIAGL